MSSDSNFGISIGLVPPTLMSPFSANQDQGSSQRAFAPIVNRPSTQLPRQEAIKRAATDRQKHVLRQRIVGVNALVLPFFLLLAVGRAPAQTDVQSRVAPEQIASDLRAIESAVVGHANDDELGKLWEQLAFDYSAEMDFTKAHEAYDHALDRLRGSMAARRDFALALDGLAANYLTTGQAAESESCRRKALAIFEEEVDSKNATLLHMHLAVSLQVEGKYKEAEKEASRSIEGILAQTDPNAVDLITAFLSRAYVRCYQHRCREGLSDAERAIDVVRRLARPDPVMAASSWLALGYMEWKTGDVAGADQKMRSALQILSETVEVPYPALTASSQIGALRQYQRFLNRTHRKAEARQVGEEVARLTSKQKPVCRNCTVNVEGLLDAPH